jgi:hypothetical protein
LSHAAEDASASNAAIETLNRMTNQEEVVRRKEVS